jgi:two-component system cell cycle sensor histidine kinase/response regulator CckA
MTRERGRSSAVGRSLDSPHGGWPPQDQGVQGSGTLDRATRPRQDGALRRARAAAALMADRHGVLAQGLEVLFAENPSAVFVFDVDGRFIAGNRALAERTGRTWDELHDTHFQLTVHPDDRERVSAEFAAAVGGEARHYRARGLRPDGETFTADVVNVPIREDGVVVGVLGIATDIDALADAQADLDRSQGLMRIASRMARLGGWAADLVTGERYWSDEIFELLGVERGEAPPRRDILEHVEPAQREQLDRAFEQCGIDGTPIDMTALFSRADGKVIHARVIGEAVRADDGRIVRVHGAVSDVTAEFEALEERRRIETRVSAALDALPDPLLFVDSEWCIRFLNRPAADAIGLPLDDLVGRELWSVREIDPEVAELIRESRAEGRTAVDRRLDPVAERWIETTAFPADDLLGLQFRDVSAVEAARSRVLDDTRHLYAQASVLDSASDAIVLRGLGDLIVYANRSATQLLGGGDVLGRPMLELLGADPEAYAAADAELAREGTWEGDLLIRRDGDDRVIACRWQLVRDPDGLPEAIFAAMNDVTEARRQDEARLRSQRMESIGTLAGGIAHDLNNVLTPLLLSTQVLSTGEEDPVRLRMLEGMRSTIERGADMIRQVLTFARGVEGERTIVDIAGLLGEFADFCRDTLPKDIVVTVTVEPELTVVGDGTQLLQLLMNLATNSRDAMPSGGKLDVVARAVGRVAVVEVRDTGSGMPPEVVGRIFEPFYTTKEMGRGTGLGLSVSQAIARTHGGSLDVRSAPGRGTTFRLELPRSDAHQADLDTNDDGAAPDLEGLRVLIVDDEEDIVEAASMLVAQAGGIPFGARSASRALHLLAAKQFDVVLTDLVMPGMSGREFLDWMATRRPTMPVVVMSGVPELLARAATGAQPRLTLDKPFTGQQLIVALARARALQP